MEKARMSFKILADENKIETVIIEDTHYDHLHMLHQKKKSKRIHKIYDGEHNGETLLSESDGDSTDMDHDEL
jgi:hypothetical protein